MTYYERRLPHWHPDGRALFITWRLFDSLPANRQIPPERLTSGRAFAWLDRILDEAQEGPTWLKRPDLARIVVRSILAGAEHLRHYDLHAYVVMPNHVHLLVLPLIEPPQFLHSLKGATSRQCNRILGRTGQPFWQRNRMTTGFATGSSWRRFEGMSSEIRSLPDWSPAPRTTAGPAPA